MANQEVVKFEVVALNGKERELAFYDTQLINHTKAIQRFRDAGNLAVLAIAKELNNMDSDKSYAKAGFKTVAEYAQVVFDYKPATVSLYLRSAKAFLADSTTADMPVSFKGNLPKLTMGQMIELLPLVENETDITKVEQAFIDGSVNQRMSTKDIRAEVNAIRGISRKNTADKTEKSAIEKATKLGEYDKTKLPKGMTSQTYAMTALNAAIEAFEKYMVALHDVEHTTVVDTKVAEIMDSMQELVAELTA